jgi:hypothetical protein
VKVLESQLEIAKEGNTTSESLEKENAELKKEITGMLLCLHAVAKWSL